MKSWVGPNIQFTDRSEKEQVQSARRLRKVRKQRKEREDRGDSAARFPSPQARELLGQSAFDGGDLLFAFFLREFYEMQPNHPGDRFRGSFES